jgi:hypothetical protein
MSSRSNFPNYPVDLHRKSEVELRLDFALPPEIRRQIEANSGEDSGLRAQGITVLSERSRLSNRRRGRFGLGTQNQEVGPHRALREPVAAEDRVLRRQVRLNQRA